MKFTFLIFFFLLGEGRDVTEETTDQGSKQDFQLCQMFIIDKEKSPECFKNFECLSCRYRREKGSWTDLDLFKEYVRKLHRKFKQQNQKMVLMVAKCLAHSAIAGFTAIQFCFLPLYITSFTQPLGQRVISSLNTQRYSRLIKR